LMQVLIHFSTSELYKSRPWQDKSWHHLGHGKNFQLVLLPHFLFAHVKLEL
jgi:hypothetical protein